MHQTVLKDEYHVPQSQLTKVFGALLPPDSLLPEESTDPGKMVEVNALLDDLDFEAKVEESAETLKTGMALEAAMLSVVRQHPTASAFELKQLLKTRYPQQRGETTVKHNLDHHYKPNSEYVVTRRTEKKAEDFLIV